MNFGDFQRTAAINTARRRRLAESRSGSCIFADLNMKRKQFGSAEQLGHVLHEDLSRVYLCKNIYHHTLISVCKYEADDGSAAVGETRCPEIAPQSANEVRKRQMRRLKKPNATLWFGSGGRDGGRRRDAERGRLSESVGVLEASRGRRRSRIHTSKTADGSAPRRSPVKT